MNLTCSLCATSSSRYPIIEGPERFCCHGCHTVYKILLAKNSLENAQNHPIFQQAVKSGLISNPSLLEHLRTKENQTSEYELQKLYFEVTEMWCPSCAEVIKLILHQTEGIKKCAIDYSTDIGMVEFYPRHISKEQIFSIIESLGYRPSTLDEPQTRASNSSLFLRFIIAAFCAFNVMMFSYPIYASFFSYDDLQYSQLFSWLSFIASIPIVTYCAFPIYRRFYVGLKSGITGMESLVVIGVISSFGLSLFELLNGSNHVYFDTLSVIVTFVLLGKIIESKAKFSTKESLVRLNRSLPKRARKVQVVGSHQFVLLKDIQIGDKVAAFSGEKVVLDGVVIEGEALCDESVVTGESWPVSKKPESQVITGSIVKHGSVVYRVTKTLMQTTFHGIIEMVEKELNKKSTYVRYTDRIVAWFVPAVTLIACVTGLFWFVVSDLQVGMINALSVLLISCPCAIGIAVPIAESYLIHAIAGLGGIVRNRSCLAKLGCEDVIVFDKTGTITEGNFRVFQGLEQLSLHDLSVLKSMTSQSIHPIAVAITQEIQGSMCKLNQVVEHSGKGIEASIGDDLFLFGSHRFLNERGVNIGDQASDHGHVVSSKVYFSKNGKLLSILLLGDQLKDGTQEMLRSFNNCQTYLLSGDSESVVKKIAVTCFFNKWAAEKSPFEKKEIIEDLRKNNQIVCMVGDGINDAPALAEADVSISFSTAADISMHVSDIVLNEKQLSVLPKIRDLAKFGQQIIKQNLFWAFFYNIVGLFLAVSGFLSPIFASFAMMSSSFIILFNSSRIKNN